MPRPRRAAHPVPQQVRPSVRRLLDSMTGTAAFVRNGRLDILAANQLGYALYSPVFGSPASADLRRPANLARFIFLDGQLRAVLPRLGRHRPARPSAACAPRPAATPDDRALTDLVGELSMRSQAFRSRWAAHDVEYYRSGIQPFRHPLVGDLDLEYDALEIPADPGQTIIVYSAEPGSAAHEALGILASWAATQPEAGQLNTAHLPGRTRARIAPRHLLLSRPS